MPTENHKPNILGQITLDHEERFKKGKSPPPRDGFGVGTQRAVTVARTEVWKLEGKCTLRWAGEDE